MIKEILIKEIYEIAIEYSSREDAKDLYDDLKQIVELIENFNKGNENDEN